MLFAIKLVIISTIVITFYNHRYETKPNETLKAKDKMASLMRVVARKSCQVLRSNTATKTIQPACFISTNKKKDSAAAAQNVVAGSRAEEAEEDEVC